jgi:hypothetical protein
MCLFKFYFRQISFPASIFWCGSSRIGEYWQVPTRRHFTTIIMLWNAIDSCSQMRLEIVRDKCWDLLNNICLIYRCLNMHLAFYLFLRVEQDLYGIKWMFSININNGNNIEDYIAYVISNLLNGHIHLY